MNNGELQEAIQDDLSVIDADQFYPQAYIQRITNRSMKWLSNLRKWQETQHAIKFNSKVDQEYYNYPENFKTDSIWKLNFAGASHVNHIRKNFKEYLLFQEDEMGYSVGSPKKELYSDHRRQLFIEPTPTTIAEISIWGHLIPADMSDDADTHPFADEAELEEVIVQYGLGLALKKGRGINYERGKSEQSEARAKALSLYDVQRKEQSKYGTVAAAMFNRIEILPTNGNRRTQTGNFNQCS